MIHITDGQTDRILSYIALGEFWDDVHRKSLKDNFETYDFTTFANKKFSQYLTKRNRVIIPDEDGNYAEFIIENTRKYRSGSSLFTEVKSTASYLELKRSKVIYPETLTGQTAQTLVDLALDDTEWKAGTIHYKGIRTIKLERHTNPYNFLKAIASEFDLELNFRVVIDRNQVVARYVDLVERLGMWKGREVEFGTDLLGIERKEDTSNIVTALIGLGPTDSNGNRMEVFVEDLDALRRWGRNGKHIVETYEPEFSSEENVTRERLETLTQNELKKRINSVVEYTGDVNDLENLLGMRNKKIRFGDTIKIKDTHFDPPLYLEARVHTQERSLSDKTRKKVTLGDYIEYTEEDVKAIWKRLQQEINSKLAKIVTVSVISSEGTVFKNGVGSTDLKALVYQGGKEIDESGMAYEYQWDVFDKDGNLVTSIYTKQITVYARDITDVGTYVVTVSSEGTKMASSAITISNVFDGQPGPPGEPGKPSYMWVKYADDAYGNGMSDDPTGKSYLGIAYNKDTPEESNDPNDYTWSPFYDKTLLDQIENDVEKAKEDAKNALMSADGKNTVFFQDTEPSKVGRKIGDLWFKTNEGNKIYRFDGSNWVPTPFGDAAIANLDVGKIVGDQGNFNWLEAKHIKSLNGLNVGNGKFIVDQYGNVIFSGILNGAKGTFSGDLESPTVVIGPKVASDIGAFEGFVGLKLKMIERVSDNNYRFKENVVIKAINSTVSFGPSNYTFMFEGPLNASRSLDVNGALYTYGDIYAKGYKLIDYGTNSNGNYIRFANGVQICWHTLSTQWFVDTPLGNIYYSGSNTWIFPASFYSTPEVFVNSKSAVAFSWAGLGSSAATYYSMSYCVFSPTRVTVSCVVSLMAIGRWRA